jgi:hypothetical protein
MGRRVKESRDSHTKVWSRRLIFGSFACSFGLSVFEEAFYHLPPHLPGITTFDTWLLSFGREKCDQELSSSHFHTLPINECGPLSNIGWKLFFLISTKYLKKFVKLHERKNV